MVDFPKMPDGRGTPEYDAMETMIERTIRDLNELVDEQEEFINDTYKYVQNLHQWAMQQHLASSSKSAPYFKGQEEALWKVLMFLGHPVACGGQGNTEYSGD